ncbi:MAG: hypothetical protein AB7V43_14610 [Acidimicrobiia bacterium]
MKALGLTEDEYKRLGQQMFAATAGLAGSKAERLDAAARRLRISAAELALLRRALNDFDNPQPERVRGLVRMVLGLPALQTRLPAQPAKTSPVVAPPPSRSTAAASKATAPPPSAPSEYSGRPLSRLGWDGDTNVYVIEHGNVVHAYSDCFGMRGFRHSQEPDPTVYQVNLRHPICAARRACRKCFDQWGSSALGSFDDYIEALHGRRDAHLAADRKGPKRKVVVKQGGKAKVTPRMPSPPRAASTQSLSKNQRRVRDAARLGMSVEELRARRRAEAESNSGARTPGKARA